jgi:hypothetical protein
MFGIWIALVIVQEQTPEGLTMKKQAIVVVAAVLGAAVGLGACAGQVDEPLTKAEAAQALAEGEDLGGVCEANGWLDDGVCDSWCVESDPACDGPGVACAEFILEPDGVCSRPTDDPCLFQDPDCVFACPAIAEMPDGVCSRPESDPCRTIDPDCEPATCPANYDVPDGVCSWPEGDPCRPMDPDCGPVACAAYIEVSDGVCSRPWNDPCILQDPDCDSIACPEIALAPDGVCTLGQGNPCSYLDPDCS